MGNFVTALGIMQVKSTCSIVQGALGKVIGDLDERRSLPSGHHACHYREKGCRVD